MRIMNCISGLKNKLVSNQTQYRKVKFGICKGCYLPINLRHQFRNFIGFYEPEIIKYIKFYVQPGSCCYDIGASVGYYSMAFSKLASPGKIYAVEADVKFCSQLKNTISRNVLHDSEIKILNYLIADVVDMPNRKVTIDYLVFDKKYTPPNLVKMDIEGAEYLAFLGAINVIRKYFPKIIVEVHSEELKEKCQLLLEREGYKVTIVNQNNFFPLRSLPYNGWLCGEKRTG